MRAKVASSNFQPSELATMLREARAPALGVEVPLVPVRALLRDRRRRRRRPHVLHVVAADGDQRAHALGGEERGDARGPAAPVVAREAGRREAERAHEVEQVLADRGLLRHPRLGGVEEARRPVAAQVRDEHAAAGGGERRRHVIERVRVVGKAME